MSNQTFLNIIKALKDENIIGAEKASVIDKIARREFNKEKDRQRRRKLNPLSD